jgi:DNA-binding IclR family transcriptional regulator
MPYQNTKPVKSVEKALRLLDLLARRRSALAGELSARCGWPKSTVYGLLAALREGGAVEQRPEDGRYYLGIRMFEFGCAVSSSWDILTAARTLWNARPSSAANLFFSPHSTAGMC